MILLPNISVYNSIIAENKYLGRKLSPGKLYTGMLREMSFKISQIIIKKTLNNSIYLAKKLGSFDDPVFHTTIDTSTMQIFLKFCIGSEFTKIL